MHGVAEELKTNTTYNGWKNYETWLVNLWLTSEECYYGQLREIVKNFDTIHEQADELEQYIRFVVDTVDLPGLRLDLLGAALSRVDWLEIVEGNQE